MMKKIFSLLTILLCTLTAQAQGPVAQFHHGDSISWQPFMPKVSINFSRDGQGMFWQSIGNDFLDWVSMPIWTGDGIRFVNEPYLQLESHAPIVIEGEDAGSQQFSIRLKTNLNLNDVSSTIEGNDEDWLHHLGMSGSGDIYEYSFSIDQNYVSVSRQARIVFSNELHHLSEQVTVISIGEELLFYVTPKMVSVRGESTFSVQLNVYPERLLWDTSCNIIGEGISGDGQDDAGNTRTYRFVSSPNYSDEDTEALIVFRNESYQISDTVRVTRESTPAQLNLSAKEMIVSGNSTFAISFQPAPQDALWGTYYEVVGEAIRIYGDDATDVAREIYFTAGNVYADAQQENLVIFRNDTYQLCDTVRVIITSTLPELPLMIVSPKEITVTNNQEARQFEVSVACRVRDVFNSIDTEITGGNEDNWLSGADSYDTETADGQFSRTYIFEYAPNYTGTDREAKIVVMSEYYGLCDTVKVTSLSELPRFDVTPKEITLTNDQEPRQFDVTLLTIPEVAVDCNYRIVTQEEEEWLWPTKIDRSTEGQVTMGFEFSPNYTGRNREALIVFYSEEYNIADTTRVLSIGMSLMFEATPKTVSVSGESTFSVQLKVYPERLLWDTTCDILGEGIDREGEDDTGDTRTYRFISSPNYSDESAEVLIVFRNESYQMSDTVRVTRESTPARLNLSATEMTVSGNSTFAISFQPSPQDALWSTYYEVVGEAIRIYGEMLPTLHGKFISQQVMFMQMPNKRTWSSSEMTPINCATRCGSSSPPRFQSFR